MHNVGLRLHFCWCFPFSSKVDVFLLNRGFQYLLTILTECFENCFWWLLLHDQNVLLTVCTDFGLKFKLMIINFLFSINFGYKQFMNNLFTDFFVSLSDWKWLKVECCGWLYVIFITFTNETNRRENYLSKDSDCRWHVSCGLEKWAINKWILGTWVNELLVRKRSNLWWKR